MKSIILSLVLVLLMAGVALSADNMLIEYRYYCSDQGNACYQQVFTDCVRGANPMSDEEPEAWIPVCGEEARKICCKLTKGILYWDGNGFRQWVPWELLPLSEQSKADGRYK